MISATDKNYASKKNYKNHCIKIGDVRLEMVELIKYLGIIIDRKLNLRQHVQYISDVPRNLGHRK